MPGDQHRSPRCAVPHHAGKYHGAVPPRTRSAPPDSFYVRPCLCRMAAELLGHSNYSSLKPLMLIALCINRKFAKTVSRDELGNLDEWPQINGNEPMEMDHEGSTKLKELNGGKLPYMTAYKNTPLP
ncbi:hypothetical protein M513_08849, partial [Trichuris suis]